MLTIEVFRGVAGKGAYRRYDVPRQENQTVLDVVTYIQRKLDPTLAYRFACRVGMCGSCAMMVDGRPRWTCRTHVAKVARDRRPLLLGPLRNLPHIRDLVADMTPFFEKWHAAKGAFEPGGCDPSAFAVISPDDAQRRKADAAIECIGCGVCHAACDVVAWRDDYLGPAALNRAWTLVNDARDQDNGSRLDAVSAADGCHRCHGLGSCAAYCPKGLNPSRSIAGLKRSMIGRLWRG